MVEESGEQETGVEQEWGCRRKEKAIQAMVARSERSDCRSKDGDMASNALWERFHDEHKFRTRCQDIEAISSRLMADYYQQMDVRSKVMGCMSC